MTHHKTTNVNYPFSLLVKCMAALHYCYLLPLVHDEYYSESICPNTWLLLKSNIIANLLLINNKYQFAELGTRALGLGLGLKSCPVKLWLGLDSIDSTKRGFCIYHMLPLTRLPSKSRTTYMQKAWFYRRGQKRISMFRSNCTMFYIRVFLLNIFFKILNYNCSNSFIHFYCIAVY